MKTILDISYVDRITYDTLRDSIGQDKGQLEDLISTGKKKKMKWYGHFANNPSAAILQGTL